MQGDTQKKPAEDAEHSLGAFFTQVTGQIFFLQDFVSLCRKGIHEGTHLQQILRATQSVRKLPEEQFQKEMQERARLEQLAKNEESSGYSNLYGLASVRLWGILEATVDDLAFELLRKDLFKPSAAIVKVKGPLLELMSASKAEQAEYLISQLKQDVVANLKPGVGRFEAVLDPLGYGGPVADEVKRSLLELSQVRNVIVHCNGKADKRLLDLCPWLKLKPGDVLYVTGYQYHSYEGAALWYRLELECRVVLQDTTKDWMTHKSFIDARKLQDELKEEQISIRANPHDCRPRYECQLPHSSPSDPSR